MLFLSSRLSQRRSKSSESQQPTQDVLPVVPKQPPLRCFQCRSNLGEYSVILNNRHCCLKCAKVKRDRGDEMGASSKAQITKMENKQRRERRKKAKHQRRCPKSDKAVTASIYNKPAGKHSLQTDDMRSFCFMEIGTGYFTLLQHPSKQLSIQFPPSSL